MNALSPRIASMATARRSGSALRQQLQRRTYWGSSLVQPHTNTNHMPFNYLNKRTFTYKFVSYLGFGFALPWVAVAWRWYRPGGFKNP